jgi:asparagine synthase (glutamine-hydrolysing)
MKIAILLSGGKDSLYAAYLAKKEGHELTCAITIYSQNPDSYMFHTPSISKVAKQVQVMEIPFMTFKTKGEKENELKDLENAIKKAIKKYKIQAITTGALHSNYQATRIQKICDKLKIKCLNPLWHKDEIKYLEELIENKFKVIITAVAAYPLDNSWLGREIILRFFTLISFGFYTFKIISFPVTIFLTLNFLTLTSLSPTKITFLIR